MLFSLASSALVLGLASCSPSTSEAAETATAEAPVRVEDVELERYRVQLLDTAFGAASLMPKQPHIKSRCRNQERVAVTALELDQPDRALAFVERIDNWRKGAGYADVAAYRAEKGVRGPQVDRLLEAADAVGQATAQQSDEQEWRLHRIRAKLAQVHALLGQDEEARALEASLSDAEAGRTAIIAAMTSAEDTFDEQLEVLQHTLRTSTLERMRTAAEACLRLHARYYADPARRAAVEESLRAIHGKVPLQLAIDFMAGLAQNAAEQEDFEHAVALADEAEAMIGEVQWLARDHVPLLARIARLRHAVRDDEGARGTAEAALQVYEVGLIEITDIWRAGVLRPIAEVFVETGDLDRAREVYSMALEASVLNPNSRPRVDDLVQLCCSMAKSGFQPDSELWSQIMSIRDGLGDPW